MTLILCGVLPRLCLFGVVFYQLARAVEIKNNAESAKEDTEYLLQVDKLFGALQVVTNFEIVVCLIGI